RTGDGGRARCVLPDVRPRQFQAAAALRLRRRNSEIPGRQAPTAQAGRGGVRGRKSDARPVTGISRMTKMIFNDPRLATLNGFEVEIDADKHRADIILNRPPLNVIEMAQRDQLRLVFEALDEDEDVRIIVLRAVGPHFSSGGNIAGFMEAT